jgi:protein O-GlcNAc transferase
MSRLTAKARTKLAVLIGILTSSGLLGFGQANLQAARELASKGSFHKADAILRDAIAADPNNVDARVLLGNSLAVQGIQSEAINQLAEAVRLSPNSAQIHNEYGTVLSRFVETKAARDEFERALELDPTLAESHVNLSLVLAQAGEFAATGEHLDRAIELQGSSPKAAYAHYLRAKVWGAQDQIDKSIGELQKAVSLNPNYEEAWSDLGGMRRLNLDNAGAIEGLQRAVALKPDDAVAQYRLGQIYLHEGNAPRALQHLRQALSRAPDDRATLYNLMLALRNTGHLQEAKSIDARLAELQHQSDRASEVGFKTSALNDEGIQLEKAGNLRAALAKYRTALDLDPTGYGFRLNYALALCRLGRWQDGVAELREVLRVDPDNADAAKALYVAVDQTKAHSGDDAKKVYAHERATLHHPLRQRGIPH